MSVVAWDGKTLAADRQGTDSGLAVKCTKIRKLDSGEVLAWVGSQEGGLALAEWYDEGCDEEAWPKSQQGDDWTRLIVCFHGKVWEYEQLPIRQRVESCPAAWGSGRDFALGAMAMGADAAKAVQVASKFCTTCGMGVDVYPLKEKP